MLITYNNLKKRQTDSLDDTEESYQKVKARERKTVAEAEHLGRKWEEAEAKRKLTEKQEQQNRREGQVYMLNHWKDD